MANWFDALWSSATDAFRFGNLIKRLLYFLLFGFLLGFTKLVSNLDVVGQSGGGFVGVLRAFGSSLRFGLGTAHTTAWDMVVNLRDFWASSSVGSLIAGFFFVVALVGFYFQPVSLFVNLVDGKGKRETGDKSGNATSGLVRLVFTVVVVLVVSMVVFYKGVSGSLIGNDVNVTGDVLEVLPELNVSFDDDGVVPVVTGNFTYVDLLGGG